MHRFSISAGLIVSALVFLLATAGASQVAAAAHSGNGSERCASAPREIAQTRVEMSLLSQPLPRALDLLSEQLRVTMVLDPSLNRSVSGVRLAGSFEEVLDRMGAEGEFVWWWDGGTVRVADARVRDNRTVSFPDVDALKREARALCLPVNALQVAAARRGNLVRIAGPKTVVSQLVELANALRARYEAIDVTRYGRTTREKLAD